MVCFPLGLALILSDCRYLHAGHPGSWQQVTCGLSPSLARFSESEGWFRSHLRRKQAFNGGERNRVTRGSRVTRHTTTTTIAAKPPSNWRRVKQPLQRSRTYKRRSRPTDNAAVADAAAVRHCPLKEPRAQLVKDKIPPAYHRREEGSLTN